MDRFAIKIVSRADEITGTTEIVGVGSVPNTVETKSEGSVTIRPGDVFMIGGAIKSSGTETNSHARPKELIVLIHATAPSQ